MFNKTNSTVPVHFHQKIFNVDPILFSQNSKRFNFEYNNNSKLTISQINIANESLSEKSVDTFLRLCQREPLIVVDPNLMIEICILAQLFEAEYLYNTSLKYIHTNIDPTLNPSVNEKDIIFVYDNDYPIFDNLHKKGNLKGRRNDNLRHEIMDIEKPQLFDIYQEKHIFKKNNYLMKLNDNDIAFAHASRLAININNGEVKIIRSHFYNDIKTANQNIKLNYRRNNGQLTMFMKFRNHNQIYNLQGQTSDDRRKNEFSDRKVVTSKKACIMIERTTNKTLIIRKKGPNHFEIENNMMIPPLIAFSLCLSAIVGPHCEINRSF